jgi:hypothetical protein
MPGPWQIINQYFAPKTILGNKEQDNIFSVFPNIVLGAIKKLSGVQP